MQLTITILVSLFGGGALLKFIEFLIRRKDNTVNERFDHLERKMDERDKKIDKKFEDLYKKLDYEAADNARIRILAFSEETQRGQKHSKESFDQVHSDIDKYNRHCDKYPDYPNSRATMAIKNIETVYMEALNLEKEGYSGFLS